MSIAERASPAVANPVQDDGDLQQFQRMAMLGMLASGIGHDLRNLVMPVALRLDVLAHSPELSDATRADLAAIRESVSQLQRLAGGLRLLGTDPFEQRHEVQFTRLSDWWPEVRLLVLDALAPNTVVVDPVTADLPPVAVPPGTLAQIVISLAMNARRAMMGVEQPRLTVSATRLEGALRLTISDNGAGMDAETRRRCFEPFFTTRTRERSTGLGLATGRALMQRYGGDLSVTATVGHGATFILRLPVREERALASGDRSPRRTVRLVVGDPRHLAMVRLTVVKRGMQVWSSHAEPENDTPRPPTFVVCDAAALPDVLAEVGTTGGAPDVASIIAIAAPSFFPRPPGVRWIEPADLSMLNELLQ